MLRIWLVWYYVYDLYFPRGIYEKSFPTIQPQFASVTSYYFLLYVIM